MTRKAKSVVIGGLPRALPNVRFIRYRSPHTLAKAFFAPMGMEPRHVSEWPDMRRGIVDMGVWAFAARKSKVPTVHYWAARDVDPLHLAYVLGHEVGHLSGRPLRSRRNAWREELRADEYGAAAFLALSHVLGRKEARP